MFHEHERGGGILSSPGTESDYDIALPAMTDLVFQLLLVFVLGVSAQVATLQAFDFDTSAVSGVEAPELGPGLFLEVYLIDGSTERPRLRVITSSVPEIDGFARTETVVEGYDQALEIAGAWAVAVKERQLDRDHRVHMTFFAPKALDYGSVLEIFGMITNRTGGGWLVGMYEPNAGGK